MIEFYNFSWKARILITVILGLCVLGQTLAMVLNFYRNRLNPRIALKNLLEIFILLQVLVFSFLHGQIVNGYKTGFVVASGYENIRIVLFILTLTLLVLVCFLKKTYLPLSLIPAIAISLPIIEKILGEAFPWFFIGALIFLLVRSIRLCITSAIAIKTNISALSVIHAIDTLDTGVLFSENDGHILLSNQKMQKLMLAMTGKTFRNSIEFYDMLVSEEDTWRYKKNELDEQRVYILSDASAWMLTKTDVSYLMKNYIHISLADVSQLWSLTRELQIQDEELRHKSDELKETIANLYSLSKKKEIENARMRAHDILGQRLSVLLRTIRTDNDIDYALLESLSKGLLSELKAEQDEIGPYDELKGIQEIFLAIGVDIKFEGSLPQDEEQAHLFVDIIREGSTNAVRHGLATEINIKSESIEETYNLTINNNGHTTSTPIALGSGIRTMRKKVDSQGGDLEIIQEPIFTLAAVLPGGDKYE